MNNHRSIKSELDDFLNRTGKSAYWLATQSGVNINVIQRVRRGIRDDMRSKTADRLRAVMDTFPTANPTTEPLPSEPPAAP